MNETETDGHWPLARAVPELNGCRAICCECGEQPKKLAARSSMQHVWHASHRRKLRLIPVDYVWPRRMEGLSTGQPWRVTGHVWRGGGWVRVSACPEGCGGTVDAAGRHSDDVEYCYGLSQQAKADVGDPADLPVLLSRQPWSACGTDQGCRMFCGSLYAYSSPNTRENQ
jgi:hypothetical protein